MAFGLSLLVALFFVGLDQMTKQLAVFHLKDQVAFTIWQDVLELRYHENDGIAFSMFAGWQWIIVPITVIIMLLIVAMMWRSLLNRSILFRVSCILILAGGIGNLIDRIALGYVVDFIYFRLIDFPIFNVADCCVVIGAVLMAVFLLFVYKEEENIPMRTLLFGITKKEKT